MAVGARRGVERHLHTLEASQWWSPERMTAWQDVLLQRLLDHSQRHVPFHTHALAATAGRPARDRLAALPPMTRAQALEASAALWSERVKGRCAQTQGTTGAPLFLRRSRASMAWQQALLHRQLHWAGWRAGDRRARLDAEVVVPLSQTAPPYWQISHPERVLVCSSYHLFEHTAPAISRALADWNPRVIEGRPSSIAFLARCLLRAGRRHAGSALTGVVTSSERLTPLMRRQIELAFGVRVYDWYGQAEQVCAVATCPSGTYHLVEEAGITEFEPLADGLFGLVGTGLHNLAMPLLRYRTGDAVVPTRAGWRCRCGRPTPTFEQVLGPEHGLAPTPASRPGATLGFFFQGG